MKHLLKDAAGYLAGSGCALAADMTILWLLVHFMSVGYLLGSALSYLTGASVACALSVNLVFEHHRWNGPGAQFIAFVAIGGVGLAVNCAEIFFLVDFFTVNYLLAKCVAAGTTFTLNFRMRRQLFFRAGSSKSANPLNMPPTHLSNRVVAIAGAGPAGLTAALELLRRSDLTPIVFEAEGQVGGISKTVNYRGNRMDLGGHRFFSKSDWVMRWWENILPIAEGQFDGNAALRTSYQGQSADFYALSTARLSSDAVMLVRRRLSRIFYRRRFFDYPLKLNANTLKNIGVAESLRIGFSYGRSRLALFRTEATLEDFFINRFGDRLYRTFFKDYTEKVWGVPCSEISAEWGAQRIKGLSVTKAVVHALTRRSRDPADRSQKRTETSLIERFLYPKFGPGQMWDEVARRIVTQGGQIHLNHRIVGIEREGLRISAVRIRDQTTGSDRTVNCHEFISTIPVRDLTAFLKPDDGQLVRIANGLPYRDFMTVGLLVRRMHDTGGSHLERPTNGMPLDNWIYIQEPDVRIGRLQIFNNWSSAMVADENLIWLGLEYFCQEGDDLWTMTDARFIDFAAEELEKIGLISREDVVDGTLVRVPKAYPAYFGEYREFDKVRAYLDEFPNLYPVGRNGMHRYNNQDHSMIAANSAVDSIVNHGQGKSKIWRVNADNQYHEKIDHTPDDRATAIFRDA